MLIRILALALLLSCSPVLAEAEPKANERKIVSIAVLTSAPMKFDADFIRPAFAKRFGVEFGKTPGDENVVAKFRENMIGVQVDGQRFGIISNDKPYSSKEAKWLERGDPRIVSPFKKHEAWFAVDWFPEGDDNNEEKAYQRIGKMVAELLDDRCLLLFAPATNQLVWLHEGTRKLLESDRPLDAMKWPDPPISFVSEDDPRMKTAVATAQKRWPEFVKRFAARKPGEMFSVKKKFEDKNGHEFMWVMVDSIEGDVVKGKVNNRPARVKHVKLGDEATVSLAELNDWIYVEGEKMVGGFTIEVLKAAQAEAAKPKDQPKTTPVE